MSNGSDSVARGHTERHTERERGGSQDDIDRT